MLKTTWCTGALLALAIAGCGGSDDDGGSDAGPPLPQQQVTKIEGTLKTVARSGGLKSVDCPAEIPAKADAEFECQTDQGTLKVTLLDARGSEVSWSGTLGKAQVTGRQTVFD